MAYAFWRKYFILLGLPLCLPAGCTAPIETRATPAYEASQVFAWPGRQLHDSIPALFRVEDLRQNDDSLLARVFSHYTSAEDEHDALRMQADFIAETATTALIGKSYFTTATSKNIYLYSLGGP